MKKITLDLSEKMTNLSNEMTAFETEIRAEIRSDLREIRKPVDKTVAELTKRKKKMDSVEENYNSYDKKPEDINLSQKALMEENVKWECKHLSKLED